MDPTRRIELEKMIKDLIIDRGTASGRWMQFYITVQIAVAGSLGVVIGFWRVQQLPFDGFFGAILIGLALLGFVIGTALTFIVMRERRWNAWFARRFVDIEKYQSVFPTQQGEVKKAPIGFIGNVLLSAHIALSVAWIFVGAFGAWCIDNPGAFSWSAPYVTTSPSSASVSAPASDPPPSPARPPG